MWYWVSVDSEYLHGMQEVTSSTLVFSTEFQCFRFFLNHYLPVTTKMGTKWVQKMEKEL